MSKLGVGEQHLWTEGRLWDTVSARCDDQNVFNSKLKLWLDVMILSTEKNKKADFRISWKI